MESELDIQVPFEELVNRGLNTKARDLHPQIDRILKEVITDKVKALYPKIRNQPWHYVKISWQPMSDKYFVRIAPGKPVAKG